MCIVNYKYVVNIVLFIEGLLSSLTGKESENILKNIRIKEYNEIYSEKFRMTIICGG